MTVRRWNELNHKFSKEREDAIRREVEVEILELNLRAIRELMGKTQEELAALVDTTQSQVSETERREDHRLSTLRRYIQALGGELEIIANFGDRRVRLHV
ncbi:MAG TPA: helix-turn-helix transcriptional regulator [Vicinamibacteria bacterium]|nr:helix-turn-helix transcriptional regulator [Vicinamibacteria bacterium]